MGADAGSRKERLAKLLKNKDIDCPVCPLHRGDNRKRRKRHPKQDRYKSERKGR